METTHRLAQYRHLADITQLTLSKRAGVSVWLISMIETGKIDPGRKAIEKLCKASNGWLKPQDFFK